MQKVEKRQKKASLIEKTAKEIATSKNWELFNIFTSYDSILADVKMKLSLVIDAREFSVSKLKERLNEYEHGERSLEDDINAGIEEISQKLDQKKQEAANLERKDFYPTQTLSNTGMIIEAVAGLSLAGLSHHNGGKNQHVKQSQVTVGSTFKNPPPRLPVVASSTMYDVKTKKRSSVMQKYRDNFFDFMGKRTQLNVVNEVTEGYVSPAAFVKLIPLEFDEKNKPNFILEKSLARKEFIDFFSRYDSKIDTVKMLSQ